MNEYKTIVITVGPTGMNTSLYVSSELPQVEIKPGLFGKPPLERQSSTCGWWHMPTPMTLLFMIMGHVVKYLGA